MGTLIAWVLVRDRFWGKRILDVIIDIPFALPTIVAGLVLLGLYGNGSPIGLDWAYTEKAVLLALAFVTLPFIVRTVQPVLEELEHDVEEAAASLGAKRLHHLPADHPAQPDPGDRRGRGAVVRPGDRGVRLAGAAERQQAVHAPRSSRCGCCPSSRTAARRPPPRVASLMLAVALFVIVRARHRAEAGVAPWLRSRPPSSGCCASLAVGYVFFLVAWPVSTIVREAFADGLGHVHRPLPGRAGGQRADR